MVGLTQQEFWLLQECADESAGPVEYFSFDVGSIAAPLIAQGRLSEEGREPCLKGCPCGAWFEIENDEQELVHELLETTELGKLAVRLRLHEMDTEI